MNQNDPAFPSVTPVVTGIDSDGMERIETEAMGGMTVRQYAAIHLCIPDSGVDWLDAMIRRKQRDDLAAKMLEGVASNPANAYAVADAMLSAREAK